MQEKKLPHKLYKYRSLNGDSFRFTQSILVHNEVYFSNLDQFNDPFEGHCNITITDNDVGNEFRKSGLGLLCASTTSINSAVFSLSATQRNILMWSHYADFHRGICIEFDTTGIDSFFNEAKCARYVEAFKEIDISDFGSERSKELVCRAKSKHWKYEQEWRLIRNDSGLVKFNPECITGVILGCKISDENLRWVRGWVEHRNVVGYKTKLSKARKSSDSYSLIIESIKL